MVDQQSQRYQLQRKGTVGHTECAEKDFGLMWYYCGHGDSSNPAERHLLEFI